MVTIFRVGHFGVSYLKKQDEKIILLVRIFRYLGLVSFSFLNALLLGMLTNTPVFTMLFLPTIFLQLLTASCQYRYFTEGNLTLPFK